MIGVNIAGSSMTYAEYYEQWVKDYKYGNLKPTTEHLYKHRIVVIRDLFGNIIAALSRNSAKEDG